MLPIDQQKLGEVVVRQSLLQAMRGNSSPDGTQTALRQDFENIGFAVPQQQQTQLPSTLSSVLFKVGTLATTWVIDQNAESQSLSKQFERKLDSGTAGYNINNSKPKADLDDRDKKILELMSLIDKSPFTLDQLGIRKSVQTLPKRGKPEYISYTVLPFYQTIGHIHAESEVPETTYLTFRHIKDIEHKVKQKYLDEWKIFKFFNALNREYLGHLEKARFLGIIFANLLWHLIYPIKDDRQPWQERLGEENYKCSYEDHIQLCDDAIDLLDSIFKTEIVGHKKPSRFYQMNRPDEFSVGVFAGHIRLQLGALKNHIIRQHMGTLPLDEIYLAMSETSDKLRNYVFSFVFNEEKAATNIALSLNMLRVSLDGLKGNLRREFIEKLNRYLSPSLVEFNDSGREMTIVDILACFASSDQKQLKRFMKSLLEEDSKALTDVISFDAFYRLSHYLETLSSRFTDPTVLKRDPLIIVRRFITMIALSAASRDVLWSKRAEEQINEILLNCEQNRNGFNTKIISGYSLNEEVADYAEELSLLSEWTFRIIRMKKIQKHLQELVGKNKVLLLNATVKDFVIKTLDYITAELGSFKVCLTKLDERFCEERSAGVNLGQREREKVLVLSNELSSSLALVKGALTESKDKLQDEGFDDEIKKQIKAAFGQIKSQLDVLRGGSTRSDSLGLLLDSITDADIRLELDIDSDVRSEVTEITALGSNFSDDSTVSVADLTLRLHEISRQYHNSSGKKNYKYQYVQEIVTLIKESGLTLEQKQFLYQIASELPYSMKTEFGHSTRTKACQFFCSASTNCTPKRTHLFMFQTSASRIRNAHSEGLDAVSAYQYRKKRFLVY